MHEDQRQYGGGSAAARYWDGVLDPHNLERAPSARLEDEIAFAGSPDLLAARAWLSPPAARPPRLTVDLGAGLGAAAFAMARAGHRVVVVETSPARLAELVRRAERAGVADEILPVLAAAEALPFAEGSIPALYTRSVLIHVDLERAGRELGRVLAPGGRAALIEPTTGNPLVNIYRRTLAPAAWAGITRYFDPERQRRLAEAALPGAPWGVRPFYLLGFLAFVFQFALPSPRLFRWTLAPLMALDRLLFRSAALRRRAWFGLIELEKPAAPPSPES